MTKSSREDLVAELYEAFSEILKRHRQTLRLTQAEMADRLELSKRRVMQYETAKHEELPPSGFSMGTLCGLASATGKSHVEMLKELVAELEQGKKPKKKLQSKKKELPPSEKILEIFDQLNIDPIYQDLIENTANRKLMPNDFIRDRFTWCLQHAAMVSSFLEPRQVELEFNTIQAFLASLKRPEIKKKYTKNQLDSTIETLTQRRDELYEYIVNQD